MLRRAGLLLLLLRVAPLRACSFIVANFDVAAKRGNATLAAANAFSKLRGPDATNVRVLRGWTFVHNLLAMTGAVTLQPFLDRGGKRVALFNGEVYNFRDLAHDSPGRATPGRATAPRSCPRTTSGGATLPRSSAANSHSSSSTLSAPSSSFQQTPLAQSRSGPRAGKTAARPGSPSRRTSRCWRGSARPRNRAAWPSRTHA
mmetsp:Transcript_24398/g.82258  ORF Transcript_24398/g.82258 Transcript_24398/m.82258 type:complete len:202 (-) Transcript_24398:288-893(-)